jgi:hypothetical protein
VVAPVLAVNKAEGNMFPECGHLLAGI